MTTPYVQPYLFFAGRCEEALAHYQTHLGTQVFMTMRYGDSPGACAEGQLPENWGGKIMHCSFSVGTSVLMGSDGMSDEKKGGGYCLSLTMPDANEARRVFEALAEGGEVFMPIDPTFWSPCFGMVTDRFGISWMITIPEMK